MPTMTQQTPELEAAIRRLVNGFSLIPGEWIAAVAEKNGEYISLPMWGTLFKVDDSCDHSNIEKLMRHLGPMGCETIDELMEFAEDYGLEFDIAPLKALAAAADDVDEYDIREIASEMSDAWRETDVEEAFFSADGWMAVGDTGILAIEFDGYLLLGINGAGYSFHDSHWSRLYDELGYKWHERG